MAPKKSATPMKSTASPKSSKQMVDPKTRAKAYKEYFSTLDADTLRGLCKEGGHDAKGTKTEMVERLSKPRSARARSGSPLRAVAEKVLGSDHLTQKQEWAVSVGALAILVLAIFCAYVFATGGDFASAFKAVTAPITKAVSSLTGGSSGAAPAAKK